MRHYAARANKLRFLRYGAITGDTCPRRSFLTMRSAAAAPPLLNLGDQSVCASCRRAGYDGLRLLGFRPLHASPIFQRPSRRDFFSSNHSLLSQIATKGDGNRDKADGALDPPTATSTQKRKTAR